MEWNILVKTINDFKDQFDKSYKCVNKDTPIKVETLIYHIQILIKQYNNIVQAINEYKDKLTEEHYKQCLKYIQSLNARLKAIGIRQNIEINVPEDLTLLADFNENQLNDLDESKPQIDTDISSETDTREESSNMPQQVALDREYVKQVSSSIPEFDGKKLSLNRFLTALRIVERTKGDQESLAVEVIKSKITGPILYKVQDETTISAIITKLKGNVKGESPDVLKAKLYNIKQKGKTASQYTVEIDNLRKQLEAAYIDDGLDPDNAEKFSTKESISAMTKNCEHDKLRIILEAGNFVTFNDVMGKYIHCSTEMTGSASTVLYHRGRGRGNNYHYTQRGRPNGRGNYNQNYQQYNSSNRGPYRGNARGNNRGRNNSNRGNNHNNGNNQGNNNVRVTQTNSENQQAP